MNILILGHRPRALKVLDELGWNVRLILPTSRPVSRAARARPHRELDFSAPSAAIITAAEALTENFPLDAVIALTEAAVYPAALLREHFRLPGLTPTQALASHDKWVMKKALAAAGIACAPMRLLEGRGLVDGEPGAEDLVEALGLPLVLKERASSGSRGTIIARTLAEVREQMQPHHMAEGFVEGLEMSSEALVVNGRIVWSNFTQYLVPGWANVLPAPLEPVQQARLLDLHQQVVDTLGIERGLTHLEVFLTTEGPVVGEIAARPPGGLLMELIEEAYDFDPWRAFMMVETGQVPEFAPGLASKCVGVFFLHPGQGTIKSIEGLEAARSIPGIDEVYASVRTGDAITPRYGVGQSVGRILASAACAEEVIDALWAAHKAVEIGMMPEKINGQTT